MAKQKSTESKRLAKNARATIGYRMERMGFSKETIKELLKTPTRGNKKKGIPKDLGYMKVFADKRGRINIARLSKKQIEQRLIDYALSQMDIGDGRFGDVVFEDIEDLYDFLKDNYIGDEHMLWYIMEEATGGRTNELWNESLSKNMNNILSKVYKALESPQYNMSDEEIDIIKSGIDMETKNRLRVNL